MVAMAKYAKYLHVIQPTCNYFRTTASSSISLFLSEWTNSERKVEGSEPFLSVVPAGEDGKEYLFPKLMENRIPHLFSVTLPMLQLCSLYHLTTSMWLIE
jgi:hypothetical protein